MFKFSLHALCIFVALAPLSAFAGDVAVCGESSGYAYYADRNLVKKKDVGWIKDSISHGKFTLTKNVGGSLDILIADATGGVFSSVSDGATVMPVTVTNDSATVMVVYPKLVETYIFQKLNDGKFQAMYTQAKAETIAPKIAAFVSDCSYLDLSSLQNNSLSP